jgi:FtsH-binding integral membrane protein
MIVGGKNRKYTFDEDSYILAAIVLYLDIINLFLYILEILGKMKS